MQNIPSKHGDIRRMFRATPSAESDVECILQDNTIVANIPSIAYVYKYADGARDWIAAKALRPDDTILINIDGVDTPLRLSSVVSEAGQTALYADDACVALKGLCKLHIKTPSYVLMSSDYSQQEPKLTAFISGEPKMIDSYKHNRDIYATIGSIAFGVPYEECLEFHPVTHEYQPEGKLRRTRSKPMVLGRP